MSQLKITRVANACVLIEMGKQVILTDPFFLNWKMIGIKEQVAMKPQELPPLTAIIGCHDIIDHWQMQSLADYPHKKESVSVYVPLKSMVRSAKKVGFNNAEILQWGEYRELGELSIEATKAQTMMMMRRINNYVLRCGGIRLFFGSEARDLEPLSDYRDQHGAVDVAVLPTNSVHLFGLYKLVMSGSEAVEATERLGAKQLFVVHDAHPSIPGLIHIKSSGNDADRASKDSEVDVVRVPTGVVWIPRNGAKTNDEPHKAKP
ncbi:MAG: MBL fold metallo-hydrolase [Planctomycetota bacterium]